MPKHGIFMESGDGKEHARLYSADEVILEFDDRGVTVPQAGITLWLALLAQLDYENVTSGPHIATTKPVIYCNGTFTVVLGAPSTAERRFYYIVNTGTGAITIDPISTNTINGSLTYTLSTQYQAALLHSNGSEWFVIGKTL